MNKDIRAVGDYLADLANQQARLLLDDPTLPSIDTAAKAVKAIEAVTTQDSIWTSKRAWAMVSAVVTALLAVPETIAILGPWAPVATAVVTAVLAGMSKTADPRPTKNAP